MKPILFLGNCDWCEGTRMNPCSIHVRGQPTGVVKAVTYIATLPNDFLFEVWCLSCGHTELFYHERITPNERRGKVSMSEVIVNLNIRADIDRLRGLLKSEWTSDLLSAVMD